MQWLSIIIKQIILGFFLMLEAAIKNELAHLYSLWSTSPLSTWLLVNILWHYIYKCTGMALPGILGTLQSEGRGGADFEQNRFQHSTWCSAGNRDHSLLSTKIKSPSTDIISVKISVKFLQNCVTGKSALVLALAKACHWRRATLCWNISARKWKSARVTRARSHKALPWALSSEVPESFPLSCDTCIDMHTQVVQMCKGNKALINHFTEIQEQLFGYSS